MKLKFEVGALSLIYLLWLDQVEMIEWKMGVMERRGGWGIQG